MQEEMNTVHEEQISFIKKEARGFTWQQIGWAIGAFAMVEFTMVGGFFDIKNSIGNMTVGNTIRDQKITQLEIKAERLENDYRNLDKRTSNVEFQLSDTYTDRLQKKYNEQNR